MSNDQYIVCKSRGCSNRIRKRGACSRVSGAAGGAIGGMAVGAALGIGSLTLTLSLVWSIPGWPSAAGDALGIGS